MLEEIDLLLLQPDQCENDRFSKPMENLGLGFISSYAKAFGYTVDIIYESLEENYNYALKESIKKSPKVIGIGITTYYYHNNVRETAKRLRDYGFTGKIVIGGHGASFFYENILNSDNNIDFVVIGMGEVPLKLALDKYCKVNTPLGGIVPSIAYKDNNEIITNSIHKDFNIDNCLTPDRSYMAKYKNINNRMLFAISSSRGCSGICKFCSINMFYKKFSNSIMMNRKVEYIITEIKQLKDNEINEFIFVDDDYFQPKRDSKDRLNQFCETLRRENLNVSFGISCRIDTVNFKILKRLIEVGLSHIFIGVEFFTENERNYYEKNETELQIVNTIRKIKELNLSLQCGFLMFHPFSTLESIKYNIKMLKIIDECKFVLIGTIMEPYYGTRMHSNLKDLNLIKFVNGRPLIKFQSAYVSCLWSLVFELLKIYMPIISIGSNIHQNVTLEWERKLCIEYLNDYKLKKNLLERLEFIFTSYFKDSIDYLYKQEVSNQVPHINIENILLRVKKEAFPIEASLKLLYLNRGRHEIK